MRDDLEDVLELYGGMPPEGQEHWRARSLPSVEFESEAERQEFMAALGERDKPSPGIPSGASPPHQAVHADQSGPTRTFRPGDRVKVNLAGLSSGDVHFSQNVETVFSTVEARVSDDPAIYRVKLLVSFRGVTQMEVPADRIYPM